MDKTHKGIIMRNYMSGFGNEFLSEAVEGAVPRGQNSPQRPPFNLYAEQVSGTAFTAPRAANRRVWLYRLRPSVVHRPFTPLPSSLLLTAPFDHGPVNPNQLRWDPLPFPLEQADFLDGLVTFAANGDASAQFGIGIHLYAANKSMERYFYNADGELLIVPQSGSLTIHTELGICDVSPNQICVMPRGLKFRVVLNDGQARGYVCENYGAQLRLPELGPIGANGLANARDFKVPVAAYEDLSGKFTLVAKFQGALWQCELDHSPLDVAGWHGNLVPYVYDLGNFNTINTVSYDHPDPSIFTVLTSPSDTAGTANVDFVIFPPRWMVAEHTFRPPWFHRNVMSEYMGLICGVYDAKPGGFSPGGGSLHNCMSPHGPDAAAFMKATEAELVPHRYENTMAFMFESRYVLKPTRFALESPILQRDYYKCWEKLEKRTKF